jgi:hypothetical protein
LCRVLERLGIDPRQYRLLLDLFDSLSERYEILGSMNTVGLWVLAVLSALLSALLSLYALAHPPVRNYVFVPLMFTMYQLLIIVAGDAANSLLNPQEASVLAHQPIGGLTYAAAKASHLLTLVVMIVVSLNALPAAAGLLLSDTRWFFPFTHLFAALLAGCFVAFLVCGTYGWLFRFVAPERLKTVALGMQVLLFAIIPAVSGVIGAAHSASKKVPLGPAQWAWFPPNWFIATALLGHSAPGYSAWQAAGTIAATGVFIFLGLRCFSCDYLARATMIAQGRSFSAGRRKRQGWLARLVRRVAGSTAGGGAYAFTAAMIRRDWNLRRQALPMVVGAGLMIAPLLAQIRVSPFAPGKFSPIHALPHLLAFMLLLPVVLLSQTDQPQGAWVFLVLPFLHGRPFARGVYLSLWLPAVGMPHLVLLAPAILFWGWTDASLFVTFSAALASLYLSVELFLMEGLPFANPIRLSAQAALLPIMLMGGACAAVLGFLQWLLFRSHVTAAFATLAVVLAAALVTRLSLSHLVSEFRTNLLSLAQAPSRIFKSVDRE